MFRGTNSGVQPFCNFWRARGELQKCIRLLTQREFV